MICNSCFQNKDDSLFYLSNRSKCKECVKASTRKNRMENLEERRESDARRYIENPKRKQSLLEYQKTIAGKETLKRAAAKWRENNKDKIAAHGVMNRAIRSGRLSRSTSCEVCNKICLTSGHHEDYFKPLEVTWLCHQCHMKLHRKHKLDGDQ